MLIQIFYVLGAIPLVYLGTMHLVFTLRDNKNPRFLVPSDKEMIRHMQAEPLQLTAETNMWRAWIGFNISHSMAVLLVGAGYAYAALKYLEILHTDIILTLAAPCLAWVFVILSKCFWFSVPFWGALISATCFTIGAGLALWAL